MTDLKQFAKSVGKVSSATGVELPRSTAFLEAVKEGGARISYAAFALVAKALGEDETRQLPGQRGSFLVKSLPITLQPFVCRSNGTYHKDVTWATEVPGDLRGRPVIGEGEVTEAVESWLGSLAK